MQERGHEYEALLEGAMSDSPNEEEVGLAALEAANEIKSRFLQDRLSYQHCSDSDDEAGDESD